ncbi:MAG: ribosome maturation factor RimP [Brevinema sp.]
MQDQELYQIVRSTIQDLGYICLEVILLRSKSKHTLKVVLYHAEHPVGSEDCTEVAEILSRRLDIDDPIEKRYDLVVESPGLEREIKSDDEYPYFIGKDFKVFPKIELSQSQKEGFFVASLISYTDKVCSFKVDTEQFSLPVEDIKKARLYYDFQRALKKHKED